MLCAIFFAGAGIRSTHRCLSASRRGTYESRTGTKGSDQSLVERILPATSKRRIRLPRKLTRQVVISGTDLRIALVIHRASAQQGIRIPDTGTQMAAFSPLGCLPTLPCSLRSPLAIRAVGKVICTVD